MPLLIEVADPRSPEQVILGVAMVIGGCAMLWKRHQLQMYSDRVFPFGPSLGFVYRARIVIFATVILTIGILAVGSSIIVLTQSG